MNSGAKAMGSAGKLSAYTGLLALTFALIAAGCSDHGPTNLYSSQLYGQNQAGANIQIRNVQEFTLGSTVTANGPDQYVIEVKNTGAGAIIGPITAQVTMQSACGAAWMQSDAGVTQTPTTVLFGAPGQAIYPGDHLVGNASNMSGLYQYSVETAFPTSCSNSADTFNVTMTDSKGDKWTGSFTGLND